MNIRPQDPLDSSLTLAAAQAARQLLATNAQTSQAAAQLQSVEPTDALNLADTANRMADLLRDPFASLMQNVTAPPEASSTTIQPAVAAPALIQAFEPPQDLTTNGLNAVPANSPMGLPDVLATLLHQASLTPLASQISATQGMNEVSEQTGRDVAATSAIAATGAFNNGQTSTPNPYTLIPGTAEALASSAYPGNLGAENYALMQQLLVPPSTVSSLDMLV